MLTPRRERARPRRLAGDAGGEPAPGRRRDDGGASTVEAVILFPVMLLFLMIAVQMAVFFHARGVATAGARVGLDAARVEDGSEQAGDDAANLFLARAGGGLTVTSLDVVRPVDGDRAEVTVEGDVMNVFPRFVFTPHVEITVDAPIEQVDDG